MEYSSTDGNTTLLWVSPEKPAGQEATSRTLHGTIQVSSIKHIHIAVRPSCMLMCSVVSNSLRPHILQPTRLFCPQDSPGKNTEVDCHFLLQRIFPIQGLNLCLMLLCFAGRFFTTVSPGKTMEQWTSSKLAKQYVKAVYCHPANLIYMQSALHKMLGWMKLKLESRFLGEISITSDMEIRPYQWQKVKRN